jgi:lactose/cellobiose-specific phosphotransferase system IIC component
MELMTERKFIWILTTMQEAFSAIIPYMILTSVVTFMLEILRFYNIDFYFINPDDIGSLSSALSLSSTIVIVVSIAYFFAKRFQISAIISVTLSLASYTTIMVMEESITRNYGFSVQAVIVPILSTVLLDRFYPKYSLGIPLQDENIHVYRLFNYIFAFAIAYLATLLLYAIVDFFMDTLLSSLQKIPFADLPTVVGLMIRDFVMQLFWFFGIHGSHAYNAFFGKSLLSTYIFPNLQVCEFNRLFVSIGGEGAGIAMTVAILVYAKEKMLKTIAKISIPFAIFNINTLLIYAIIVFNRYLFIPFVFVPLFNIAFAYGVLSASGIAFSTHNVVWITPVFIDSYIKTGGSIYVYAIQIFLLAVDTAVYLYFIKKFLQSQSMKNQMQLLEQNLDIPYSLRANQNVESFIARREIIESNAKLNKVIKTINVDNMMIYFQPKIDIRANRCNHFEALIRHRKKDGTVVGPYFLDLIEKARMAPVIDIWVAKEVKRALELWRKSNFVPTININLHPDTLSNEKAITIIGEILNGEKVNFEIIERSFVQGDKAVTGLGRLQKDGFGISIDDYGIGYSNMETILNHKINELKIDKIIIDRIEEPNGALVCKHTIEMCDSLGVGVVAEGVETKKQFMILREMQVGFIQGFYFSRAIPFEQVEDFSKDFDTDQYLLDT